MIESKSGFTKFLSALVITCAMATIHAQPAAAQTASNLICNGCVGTKDIKKKAVRTNRIRNNAVTSGKIADGAVRNGDLGNNAVTGAKIANGAVSLDKLSADVQAQLTASGTGDITGVAAGTGLNGGGASGDVTLNVNFDGTGNAGTAARSDHGHTLAPGSVGSAEVLDGSLTAADLAAGAVTSSELDDSARAYGNNGVIVVPAAAFQPDSETADYFLPLDGYLRPGTTSTSICVFAPVYLPDGVSIRGFEITAVDANPLQDFTFELQRVDIDSAGVGDRNQIASVSTTSALPVIRTFSAPTIDNGLVDAGGFAYAIWGCLRTNSTSRTSALLYAARITY